jgi:localization factor PodJL
MTGQPVAKDGRFMTTRRSYLDTLNAGRQRRPEPSIEELDRTLAGLEGRGQAAVQPRASTGWLRTEQQPAAPRNEYQAAPRHAPAPDLRSLAGEMERARRQEDGVSIAGRIAAELKAMREELRQQMSQALKREFDGLRQDIQRLGAAKTGVSGGELASEFERLSDAVRTLSERSDDRSVNLLRLELEQVKGALDSLAREDTLKSVGRRWEEFDQKWSTLETRLEKDGGRGAQPDVRALSAQLERISETVSGLPESLSLRTLDERLKLLANSVDHFAAQYAKAMPEAFGLIEQRLDEISRAIASSTMSARAASFDPEPFERIEARVGALARQIDELVDDQGSAVVSDRLNMLAQRVDDIAERVDIPEEIVARLGQQLADISAQLDRAPAPTNVDAIFDTLDDRFAQLSQVMEQRQGDAMEQGHTLFRELERRLDEVANRIEARETPASNDAALLDAIEQRFADLTQRLGSGNAGDNAAIVGLETRLDDVSRRLEQAARRAEGIDPQIIRSLEAQVASLSTHLSRPGAPLPEFEDLGPRLAHIEQSLSGNREVILEAARRAAHDAVGAMERTVADPAAFSGLAGDLRALEAMTRKSDERNAKTFEAIHEMLIKVVDRLGSLEHGGLSAPMPPARAIEVEPAPRAVPARPAAPRSPAEAAAAAASHAVGETKPAEQPAEGRRSMLSGLTRAFRKDKDAPAEAEAAHVEPAMQATATFDEPLDPKIANQPLEPGSGAPDLTAIIRRVRDEASAGPTSAEAAKSDFIAAARRAAQAAAAEAQTTKRGTDALSAGTKLKLGDLLKNRRKSVLMAATALIFVLGGWQLSNAFLSGGPDDAAEMAMTAPEVEPAPVLAAAAPELASEGETADVAETEAPAVRILDSAANAQTAEETTAALPEELSEDESGQEVTAIDPSRMAAPVASADPAPVESGPVALREAADGGDPKAMFEIASRYAEGRGVKANLGTAAQWYRQSAELGYAPAQYRLGNLFEKGNGVDRDPAEAMIWYDKAAKQGNASAMHNLAVLYAMGASGAADNDAAARWFLEAAELGVTDSQYNLGILSAKGAGVPQSLEESYKWFALVAKAGDRDAAAKRDEVAKALRPEQLDKAKAAAELWKPRAVDPETNVVDIPEEWTEGQTQTASIDDMKSAIRNIQTILGKNGYDAGTPDGVMGAKTRSAIMAFQADNGMPANGEVSEQLIKALLERR